MSSIHFFITPSNLTASTTEMFGPLNANEFSTSTKFSAGASNALAYAVCKGHLLITPQAGSSGTLVNAILKPAEPILQGLPIKYIVYRGLQTSSFFTSATPPQVLATGSDLINKVRADFASLYGNLATPPTFYASQLGFYDSAATDWADSKKLSSAFLKITDSTEPASKAYELPLVQAGESIGTFASNAAAVCGIDVVLDYGDYELPASELAFDFNLNYVRKADNKIDVSTITNAFTKKVTREQIYQFIDIAALYGAAQQQGIEVSYTDASGTKLPLTGDTIYTQLISKFTTKNNWYVYIQSDRQRSYNFYGNYTIGSTTNNLYYGATSNALTAAAYANQSWPLLIVNSAQNHSNSVYKLYVKLVTDNNKTARAYVSCGGYANAEKNNFGTAKTLLNDPNHADYAAGLTQLIELTTPASGSNGAKKPVCSVLSMIYHGVLYSYVVKFPSSNFELSKEISFNDDYFGFIESEEIISIDNINKINNLEITKLNLSVSLVKQEVCGLIISNTLVCRDNILGSNRVTFIAKPTETSVNMATRTNGVTNDLQTKFYSPASVSESEQIKISGKETVDIGTFNHKGELVTSLQLNIRSGKSSNLTLIGFTEYEYSAILNLIHSAGIKDARLTLLVTEMVDENYSCFKLAVIGLNSSNKLELFTPEVDINIFTVDEKYFHSSDYSKDMSLIQNDLIGRLTHLN